MGGCQQLTARLGHAESIKASFTGGSYRRLPCWVHGGHPRQDRLANDCRSSAARSSCPSDLIRTEPRCPSDRAVESKVQASVTFGPWPRSQCAGSVEVQGGHRLAGLAKTPCPTHGDPTSPQPAVQSLRSRGLPAESRLLRGSAIAVGRFRRDHRWTSGRSGHRQHPTSPGTTGAGAGTG